MQANIIILPLAPTADRGTLSSARRSKTLLHIMRSEGVVPAVRSRAFWRVFSGDNRGRETDGELLLPRLF